MRGCTQWQLGSLGISSTWPPHDKIQCFSALVPSLSCAEHAHVRRWVQSQAVPRTAFASKLGCGMPGWRCSSARVTCQLAARHWGHYKPSLSALSGPVPLLQLTLVEDDLHLHCLPAVQPRPALLVTLGLWEAHSLIQDQTT